MKLYRYLTLPEMLFNDIPEAKRNNDEHYKAKELNEILTNGVFRSSKILRFNDVYDSCARYVISKDDIIEDLARREMQAGGNGDRADIMRKIKEKLEEMPPDVVQGFVESTNAEVCKKMRNLNRTHFGAICFSSELEKPSLWGHYANKGQGVVVEIESESAIAIEQCQIVSIASSESSGCFYKVSYGADRPILTMDKLGNMQDPERSESIRKAFLTKHSDWEFEAEYRCVTVGEGVGLKFDPIKVYLGPEITDSAKTKLKDAYPSVAFVETELSMREYKILPK